MLLLELVLVAVAQIDHRLHVDFVERGQDRRRRLRLHQPLGDARAQPRHRHALLGPLAEGARGRLPAPARARPAAGVAAGACAAGWPPSHAPSTSPLVTRPPRPVPLIAPVSMFLSAASFLRRRHRRRGCRFRRSLRLRPRAAAAACGGSLRRGLASVSICAITSLLATVLPSPLTILTSTPGLRRRRLEHHLVGLDVDQILVALDVIARLLVPRHQRRLGDRFRQAAAPLLRPAWALRSDRSVRFSSPADSGLGCSPDCAARRAGQRERLVDQFLLLLARAATCSRLPAWPTNRGPA